MKIKTDRNWHLRIVTDGVNKVIEIIEIHADGGKSSPVEIPVESIDEVVLYLLKAKAKYEKR